VGISTAIISFLLTGALCLGWLTWRYPGNNAQGTLGRLSWQFMLHQFAQ
jgi:hypothetical protein